MSVQSYDYEPDFAPESKMILQTNFSQTEVVYKYWESLYEDKVKYEKKKLRSQSKQCKELSENICFRGKNSCD